MAAISRMIAMQPRNRLVMINQNTCDGATSATIARSVINTAGIIRHQDIAVPPFPTCTDNLVNALVSGMQSGYQASACSIANHPVTNVTRADRRENSSSSRRDRHRRRPKRMSVDAVATWERGRLARLRAGGASRHERIISERRSRPPARRRRAHPGHLHLQWEKGAGGMRGNGASGRLARPLLPVWEHCGATAIAGDRNECRSPRSRSPCGAGIPRSL